VLVRILTGPNWVPKTTLLIIIAVTAMNNMSCVVFDTAVSDFVTGY